MSAPSAQLVNMQPTIPVGQSIYEEATSAKTRLGYKVQVGETTYAYAKAGTNLIAGGICTIVNNTEINKATAGAVVAVGTYELPVYTVSDWSANQYADAYIACMDSAGEGICYRIKSHPAITATTAGQKVTLYDPINVALAATSKLTMTPHPYSAIKQGTDGTATAPVLGVSPIAVTSGNYFWMAISGPTGVKMGNGAITFGNKIAVSTTSQGLAVDATANATNYVGLCLSLTGTAYDTVIAHISCDRGL